MTRVLAVAILHTSMISAVSYESICSSIQHRAESNKLFDSRMIGILFAPPGQPLAKAEVIDRLEDFHYRSANFIDFYCAGYAGYSPNTTAADWENKGFKPAGPKGVFYSPKHFNDVRQEVAKVASWKYSGGVELILVNGVYDNASGRAGLDFGKAIVLDIDKMRSDGSILSTGALFEQVIQFAEEARVLNPDGFSNKQATERSSKALSRFITSLAGTAATQLAQEHARLEHFAVRPLLARK